MDRSLCVVTVQVKWRRKGSNKAQQCTACDVGEEWYVDLYDMICTIDELQGLLEQASHSW